VRLSRSRIVVVLRYSVNVYTFMKPPERLSTFKTADNHLGLCCLGSRTLAFPGRTPGQVQLVEQARGNVSIIAAHSTPLRAMVLSADGDILATASETVRFLSQTFPLRVDRKQQALLPFLLTRKFWTGEKRAP
jgi:hypothetical protein